MNRFFKYLLCFTLLLLMVSSFAFAEEDIRIRFDGEFVEIDTPPVIVDGRTLVPLRDTFNLFNFEVDWEANTKTAIGRKGEFEIRMPIGYTDVTVAGNKFVLDVEAQLINGKTYIPLRFVSEQLGAEVKWNSIHRYVDIVISPLKREVEVPDHRFEEFLKTELQISDDEDIILSDIRYLINLDISDKYISKIDGIEHMIFLKSLNASNNSITKLSPIKDLVNLEHINLKNNLVKDSYYFTDLKSLVFLDVSDNSLDDASGITDLNNLKELYISDNDLRKGEGYSSLYYIDPSVLKDITLTTDDEPEYNTWNLRHKASFQVKVAEGVYWVPANRVGFSTIFNEDFDDIIRNTPQGKQSHIKSVFELLQYLSKTDFKFIDDDKKILGDGKRLWSYHKNPLKTLDNLYGSEKAFSIAAAYTLKRDYFDSGVLVMITNDGNYDYINYVTYNNNYYLFYPKQYLKTSYKNSAREDGSIETYLQSAQLAANIHKVGNLIDFAKAKHKENLALAYSINVFDDEKAQYPESTYDVSRNVTGKYYFLPVDLEDENYWTQRMNIIFDKTDDGLYLKWSDLELNNPGWK